MKHQYKHQTASLGYIIFFPQNNVYIYQQNNYFNLISTHNINKIIIQGKHYVAQFIFIFYDNLYIFIIFNFRMDMLKNRVVQGVAVVGLLVGLGILLFKKDKVRQPVRPLKRDVVESDKNDSEALSKSQCGVNRTQQQKEIVAKEKLSDGQISDLLQEIAIQAQKYLWTSEKENIFRAHESKGADFKQFVEKLRDILLNQEAEVENFINRQKELLKSEGVNSEIITAQGNTFQAKINQFLTNNTNENHKELARVSITEKTNYLKKNGQQIINNINKACQEWKEEHLRYIPFVLNLIVTEEVYYKNTELTENSMQISWAIKKYANELAEQLVAWDNTVGDLLGNLNPQILKA